MRKYTKRLWIFFAVIVILSVIVVYFLPSQKATLSTFSPNVIEIVAPKTGLKAYFFEEHSNPIVSVDIAFVDAGLAQNKIGNILSKVLTDDESLQEKLELGGIGLDFSASVDDFMISILAPKSSLDEAISLFKTTFYNPQIQDFSLQKAKEQLLLGLERQTEHPQSVLALGFNKALYGNHPYGDNPLGSKAEISKTSKAELHKYLQTAFAKDNIVIGIAGDISPLEAGNIIDEMFLSLPQKSQKNPIVEIKIQQIDDWILDSSAQNIMFFATNSPKRLDADFYPLYIANYILGGSGLNSRLAKAMREKEGLVYSVYTTMSLADKSSIIKGGFSSSADSYKKAFDILQKEMAKFAQGNITKQELEQAKKYLISSHNLRFASISGISQLILYMQKENLGLNFLERRNQYVESVTLKEVNQMSQKYYNFNQMSKMSIGEKNDI